MNRIIVFLVLLIVLIAALAFGWWAYTLPGKVTVPIGGGRVHDFQHFYPSFRWHEQRGLCLQSLLVLN